MSPIRESLERREILPRQHIDPVQHVGLRGLLLVRPGGKRPGHICKVEPANGLRREVPSLPRNAIMLPASVGDCDWRGRSGKSGNGSIQIEVPSNRCAEEAMGNKVPRGPLVT